MLIIVHTWAGLLYKVSLLNRGKTKICGFLFLTYTRLVFGALFLLPADVQNRKLFKQKQLHRFTVRIRMKIYVVCLLNSRKTLIEIKQLKIEPRLFLAFFSVGPGDVYMFFPVLSLSPERLGDVRRCAIFRTPSSSFWEAC
jgi:hypothetical protein